MGIVGGGIFGVTAAVELARDGHSVDLFERNRDLLLGASGANQYRLHRGYHYPRSPETAVAAMRSEPSFRARYREAVVEEHAHYYAIARTGSRTSAADFLRFCERLGLVYEYAWYDGLRRESVELCVRVQESAFDPASLRELCWRDLREAGVRVQLRTDAIPEMLTRYDFVVVATYAALNELSAPVSGTALRYQFEVCEKPVLRLPKAFQARSIVVLDGPFTCVDPLGRSDCFVMGHVVHAIHCATVGDAPVIPAELQEIVDRGVVSAPPMSKFPRFLASAGEFFEGLEHAEHVGSMFTVRTVLPETDATDERPTQVRRLSDRAVAIFSGKVGTCVESAREIACIARQL